MTNATDTEIDLKGQVPESWACVDCGFDTAPGLLDRVAMEKALSLIGDDEGVPLIFNNRSEVYCVRTRVWEQAGIGPFGGCLCIGCLEKRIGRVLRPKDFQRGHEFNIQTGTPRLLQRRGKRR